MHLESRKMPSTGWMALTDPGPVLLLCCATCFNLHRRCSDALSMDLTISASPAERNGAVPFCTCYSSIKGQPLLGSESCSRQQDSRGYCRSTYRSETGFWCKLGQKKSFVRVDG